MGAILSLDMTKEAILAKLSYLLGKGLSISKTKILMMTCLKGELTERADKYNSFCEDDILKDSEIELKENYYSLNDYSPGFINKMIK